MATPTSAKSEKPEPFPTLSPITSSNAEDATPPAPQDAARPRATSSTARARTGTGSGTRKTRSASLLQSLMESNPPLGAWQAIGGDTAMSPTLPEIRNGSYNDQGWSHEGQLEKRKHKPHDIHQRRLSRSSSQSAGSTRRTTASASANPASPVVPEEVDDKHQHSTVQVGKASKSEAAPLIESTTKDSQLTSPPTGPDETGEYPNGYRFPKKHTWQQSCAIFARAFWKFFCTVKGFLITIYALNVVAWGAMIFFLLIPGATPAMCKSYPDCEDKRYSARQIWIENCSQILTALFCVTAFGLLPWRIRDFYYMIKYQVFNDYDAHRKLAGFYRSWYRLPGSDKLPELLGPPAEPEHLKAKSLFNLRRNPEPQHDQTDLEKVEFIDDEITSLSANPAVPLPPWSMPAAPLTGIRARPTKFSALAWMIWLYIWNTLFQVGLCVVMWGYNRFQRNHPYFTALVALFITMGCFTGIGAGIIVGREGSVIKETEGIQVKDYDVEETQEDFEERMAKKKSKEEKKEKKKSKIPWGRKGSEEVSEQAKS